jgi:lipopolysaccharide export system protein LptA
MDPITQSLWENHGKRDSNCKAIFSPMQMKVVGAPRIAQLKRDAERLKLYLGKNGKCTKTYNATANMKIHKDYLLEIIDANGDQFAYDDGENTVKLLSEKIKKISSQKEIQCEEVT